MAFKNILDFLANLYNSELSYRPRSLHRSTISAFYMNDFSVPTKYKKVDGEFKIDKRFYEIKLKNFLRAQS